MPGAIVHGTTSGNCQNDRNSAQHVTTSEANPERYNNTSPEPLIAESTDGQGGMCWQNVNDRLIEAPFLTSTADVNSAQLRI